MELDLERASAVPGDAILHPLALAAIALLVVNDHLLKGAAPGPITGKLSDVAGLVFFPVLLVGGWELARRAVSREWHPSTRAAVVAVVSTGVAFAAIKTLPFATDGWAAALGFGQWLIALPAAIVNGSGVGQPHAISTVTDPTDLVALPALVVGWWILMRRAQRTGSSGGANPTGAGR